MGNSTFDFHRAVPEGYAPCPTRFRSSVAKACSGRPGNSLALKQSGPLIRRGAQAALKRAAEWARAVSYRHLYPVTIMKVES